MAADVTPSATTNPAPQGNVTAPVALVWPPARRQQARCGFDPLQLVGALHGTVRLANGAQAAATIAAVKTYGKGKVRIPRASRRA